MGWENVADAEGFGLSLTGMFIVFSGLVLISLYIFSLPRILVWFEAAQARVQQRASVSPMPAPEMPVHETNSDEALLVAIGCAIQLELELLRASDAQRITIRRDESERNWAIVGKMRTLSTRM